jgi:hypothetical protein
METTLIQEISNIGVKADALRYIARSSEEEIVSFVGLSELLHLLCDDIEKSVEVAYELAGSLKNKIGEDSE